MEIVYRQTGKMPPQLEPMEMPESISYLWYWFCDLSSGRSYSEAGLMPLTYMEIKAWSDLMRIDVSAWEVGIIRGVDRVFLSGAMKK